MGLEPATSGNKTTEDIRNIMYAQAGPEFRANQIEIKFDPTHTIADLKNSLKLLSTTQVYLHGVLLRDDTTLEPITLGSDGTVHAIIHRDNAKISVDWVVYVSEIDTELTRALMVCRSGSHDVFGIGALLIAQSAFNDAVEKVQNVTDTPGMLAAATAACVQALDTMQVAEQTYVDLEKTWGQSAASDENNRVSASGAVEIAKLNLQNAEKDDKAAMRVMLSSANKTLNDATLYKERARG